MTTYIADPGSLTIFSSANAQERAPITVNDFWTPLEEPTVNFSWTPTSGTLSYTVDGVTYNTGAPKTAVNTAITFTASASFSAGSPRTIVGYDWNFGDGSTATGAVVIHTYKATNMFTRATLRVTDDLGRTFVVGHQIYVI